MPLINCKVHLKLNWIEVYILLSVGDSAKFKIIDAKLHVSIVKMDLKDLFIGTIIKLLINKGTNI